jgi:hypothetical protein
MLRGIAKRDALVKNIRRSGRTSRTSSTAPHSGSAAGVSRAHTQKAPSVVKKRPNTAGSRLNRSAPRLSEAALERSAAAHLSPADGKRLVEDTPGPSRSFLRVVDPQIRVFSGLYLPASSDTRGRVSGAMRAPA